MYISESPYGFISVGPVGSTSPVLAESVGPFTSPLKQLVDPVAFVRPSISSVTSTDPAASVGPLESVGPDGSVGPVASPGPVTSI
jgi:hypothetical protein